MVGVNDSGGARYLTGTAVMGCDPEDPTVLLCGKIDRDLGDEIAIYVEWSNAPRHLVGLVKRVPRMFVYSPEAFQAVMATEEFAEAQTQYLAERVSAALAVWGIWAIEDPGSKHVAELRFALALEDDEVNKSLYAAYIQRDAKENGVLPQPDTSNITLPEGEGQFHLKADHERFQACRYCSPTVAAVWRAGQGVVEGLRRIEQPPGQNPPSNPLDAPQDAAGP